MKGHIFSFFQRLLRHQLLIENFTYLSVLQILNLLIPLFSFPYLIKVLGMETYGSIIFAGSIVTYLVVFISYGFNISATQEISIYRDDKEKLSEIVSSILIIKTSLFIISSAFFSLLIIFLPWANTHAVLLILSLWSALYEVIFPVWYFQGIEQMRYITIITLISRLVFLILIFVLIHHTSDYLLVPLAYGVGAITSGVISLIIIFRLHQIRFRLQPYQTLHFYFKTSTPIFISNVFISIYISTNKVFSGLFLGNTSVAYLDLAEKLTNLAKTPQMLITQSVFPKISRDKSIHFIKKIFRLSLVVNVSLALVMVFFAKNFIQVLGGQQMMPAYLIIVVLAFTVPIIGISNALGFQILIPFGYSNIFSRVIIFSAVFYLLQLFGLWTIGGITLINVALVTLSTEILVSILMFFYCKKYKIWV